jgi:type II secretory pathway component PulF
VVLDNRDGPLDEAHRTLTRKFIGTLAVAIILLIIALGIYAVNYADKGGAAKTVLLIIVAISLVAGIVSAVFSARFARQIGRLGKH